MNKALNKRSIEAGKQSKRHNFPFILLIWTVINIVGIFLFYDIMGLTGLFLFGVILGLPDVIVISLALEHYGIYEFNQP